MPSWECLAKFRNDDYCLDSAFLLFLSLWPPQDSPPCLPPHPSPPHRRAQADCLEVGRLLGSCRSILGGGDEHQVGPYLGHPHTPSFHPHLWPWMCGAPITQWTDSATGDLGEQSQTESLARGTDPRLGPQPRVTMLVLVTASIDIGLGDAFGGSLELGGGWTGASSWNSTGVRKAAWSRCV